MQSRSTDINPVSHYILITYLPCQSLPIISHSISRGKPPSPLGLDCQLPSSMCYFFQSSIFRLFSQADTSHLCERPQDYLINLFQTALSGDLWKILNQITSDML